MLKNFFSAIYSYLLTIITRQEIGLEFPELIIDKRFIFNNNNDMEAYLRTREALPLEIVSHTFNEVNNKGVFLFKYKHKFFVLCYKDLKDNIIEVLSFSGIGKKEFVCPLDLSVIDDIRLSNGSAMAYYSTIVLEDATIAHELIIKFKKILEYVDYSEVTETSYHNFSNGLIGTFFLKNKIKPKKYEHPKPAEDNK